jgi:tetratricopeptide (TPR) repeat protein
MDAPRVFISYSHKDEVWEDRLVTQLGVLQKQGLLDIWADTRIHAGDDWYPEIQKAMNTASVAILMVTANFLTSDFILMEEVPRLLERRAKEGVRVFPVIVSPCAWKQVKWLSRMQVRPKDGKPLSGGNDYQIDADLAAIAEEVAAIVERAASGTISKEFVPLPPDKISLAKLPTTSPELFGREKELALLDKAWEDEKSNIVTFVAWGGVGKTALVNKWLNQMSRDHFRGAERVFGWSFYSQGAREGSQVSADPFIAEALGWFGYDGPPITNPWQKAERLAELIRQQRTLLILDGVEPLQNPPGVEQGRIKDQGLCCLLRELAYGNPGLCVMTTRMNVVDLQEFTKGSVVPHDLEDLSPEAGAQLLASLGVKGTDTELKEAAGEVGGHALALTLLGTYVATVFNGDIRQRDKMPKLRAGQEKAEHAKHVMEWYERLFEDRPELEILRIMGLFDRPAETGAIDAVKHLRDVRLLAPEDPLRPDALDCHPLIREHFGEKLKKHNPKAWKEAHSRLYEYYKSAAEELPDTIEEMAPLYAAVAHGCQAGQHQEAFDEVYWVRIQRGDEAFNTSQLGAIGSELAVLASFFHRPWSKPLTGLKESDKANILNEAGFDLRALGRLQEAGQSLKESLCYYLSDEEWAFAARVAVNLSELFLTIGNLDQAKEYARQSVELADRSGHEFLRMVCRATGANVLYHAGRIPEAASVFTEAEKIQEKDNPQFPLLYSSPGYNYCDLLLRQGKYREVRKRASRTLVWETQKPTLLDIALCNLSLGRVYLLQALEEVKPSFTQAATLLNKAVDYLRKAGYHEYIARGLLARAELYRVTKEFDKAQKDIDEAMTIATRGQMHLHKADCHLEQARLHLAQGKKTDARPHFE